LVDIKKRSGEVQRFDRNKLKNSVKKAGANEYDAEKVTSIIEKRATNETTTSQIREWVYIELRAIPSRMAAEDYKSYKKMKEITPSQK
jgi:transcriptional regulator NrdR family protein